MADGAPLSWQQATDELSRVFTALPRAQYADFTHALRRNTEHRYFFSGQGRSGLSAQMAAMRFMHLGRDSHVVGEATAPSVRSGDHLVLVSGSGRTPVSLGFARIGREEGATLYLVTHQERSPLAELADHRVVLPAAESEQFGGTLFEQSALIVLDSIVGELMRDVPDAATVMSYRHTNLQ